MKVDFNNLRRKLIASYNGLVNTAANTDRMPEEAYDQIREHLEALRNDIVILACIYDEQSGIVSLANEKILVVP